MALNTHPYIIYMHNSKTHAKYTDKKNSKLIKITITDKKKIEKSIKKYKYLQVKKLLKRTKKKSLENIKQEKKKFNIKLI